jgi:hypothetical protein
LKKLIKKFINQTQLTNINKRINKKDQITIVIVSRNRKLLLLRLLSLINLSSKLTNKTITVIVGTENNQYSSLKNYSHLEVKVKRFPSNTHPTYIKNTIYSEILSHTKVFLDDDIIIKKDFVKNLLLCKKKFNNCFIKMIPVSYFSNQPTFYKKTNLLECIGFIEIGKKKFSNLFKLFNVGEDTELANRINFKNYKIYETNLFEIIHLFGKSNRSINRLKKYGIENTIEIFRTYGLLNNIYILVIFIFKIIQSIIFNFDIVALKSLLKKFFFKKINKTYLFRTQSLISPPYNDYVLNKKFNYFDFLFHKLDKNYSKNIDNILFIRTLTFELFQKEYRKLSAIFKSKLFYCIAPFYDQQKLLCDQHFSKYNVSSSSFKNMNIFLNNSTFKHNLFFIILDHQDLFMEFFLKLNNFYIFKNIFKIRNIYIGRGNNYFNITKTTYIFVSILILLISLPLFLLSIILFIILINPLKFYSKSI